MPQVCCRTATAGSGPNRGDSHHVEITSKNIANRTFTVTHRGNDRKEVQDFLAEIAHEIAMQQIRNGDFNRPSNAVVDSVMGTRSGNSEPASSDPEVAGAFEARSQAAAGLATMPADMKKPDLPSGRPISSVKFDELSNAEREIVSRLSVTSKDLQRSYGGPKSDSASPGPETAVPAVTEPAVAAASSPPAVSPASSASPSPAPAPRPPQPKRSDQPRTTAATQAESVTVDVGDDLEVVKNASSLLDGVLDDVMDSLRGGSS